MRNILTLFSVLICISCNNDDEVNPNSQNYRQEMRNFVQGISSYAKAIDPNFVIIPQNGQELITTDGESNGPLASDYLQAIDGIGREDLFYGYDNDDEITPSSESDYMIGYLDVAKANDIQILVTDYCSTHSKMEESFSKNQLKGYISFAANHRELDNIPDFPLGIINENNSIITNLSEVKNFLYLINPSNYSNKADFINAVTATNYDLIIMDGFFNDELFTIVEIDQLKNKANGGKRMVVAYMSIGEAENYRYYWQNNWSLGNPTWLAAENPDWAGNYKVRYWDTEWQNIISGNNDSYLKKILDSGFDGVYLDIIDAFEYFE